MGSARARFDGFGCGGRMNIRARELPPIVRTGGYRRSGWSWVSMVYRWGGPWSFGRRRRRDGRGILALNRVLRKAILPIVDDRAAAVVDGGAALV